MICPKCQFQPQQYDSDVVPGVCPACGIAYAKWLQTRAPKREGAPALSEAELAAQLEQIEAEATIWQRVHHYTCFMPSDRDESAFWGHGLLYVGFFVWAGISFCMVSTGWCWVALFCIT